MRQANILSAICIGFLVGVLGFSFFELSGITDFVVLGFVMFAGFILFFPHEALRIVFIACCFCCIGGIAFYLSSQDILEADLYGVGQKISFDARIINTPDKRASGATFLIVRPIDEHIIHNVRITIYSGSYRMGEYINVSGILEEPENFSGFDYRGWLAKQEIAYVVQNPSIRYLGRRQKSINTILSDIRVNMRTGIENMLPPYPSSLYRAMILGERGAIDKSTQENLQRAGLSHIVAISGMHIAVLFFIIFFIFSSLNIPRAKSGVIAICIIGLYALMIGTPASVTRAASMVSVFFIAERIGRPHNSLRILLLIATIMVALNPLIIRYDVGFQLSFVAVLGIIVSLQYHDRFLFFITERLGLRSLIGVSLSAQGATLPLVVGHFGFFPVLGIISNVLVVSILPLLLILGIVTMVLGVIGVPSIIASPAFLLAEYVRQISIWFS